MENLVSSFYKSGGSGTQFAANKTELEIEAPSEGISGYTQPIEHAINHVFLNGIKLQYGAANDYVVDPDTNSVKLSADWTVFTQDTLLITS